MSEQASIIIGLTDNASAKAKVIGQEIDNLGRSAQTAATQAQGFALKGAAMVGAITGMAYGVARLVDGYMDLVIEGEGLTKTTVALDRALMQAGVDAGLFREAMRNATGKEVDLAGLEKQAFALRKLGFEYEQIPAFMAAAKSAADIANEDVATATEGLGKALSVGSSKALRPYGVLIDKTTVLAEAARKAGIPVAALTEAQERSALISAGMAQLTGKLADSVDGMGSAAERAKVRWSDAFAGMKKSMAGGIPGMFGSETANAFAGSDTIEKQAAAARKIAQHLARVQADAQKEAERQAGRGFFGSDAALERAQETVRKTGAMTGELYRALTDNLKELAGEAQDTAEKLRGIDLAVYAGAKATDAWIASLDKQEDELYKSAKAVEALSLQSGLLGKPMAVAAKMSEEMAVKLGIERGKLEAVQAAYRATPELLDKWRAKLYELQAAGQGAGKDAKQLESWVKIAESAQARIQNMTAALSGFMTTSKELAALQKVLPPDMDPGAMARVAEGLRQVEATQKALDESIAKGEGVAMQRTRLEALSGASLQYIEAMKAAGVEGKVLDQVQQALVDSAFRYAQSLNNLLTEGRVFRTLAADAMVLWSAMSRSPEITGLAAVGQAAYDAYALGWGQRKLVKDKEPGAGNKSVPGSTALDEYELAELAGQRAADANAEFMAVIDADKQYFADKDAVRQAAMAEKADVLTRGLVQAQEDRIAREAELAAQYQQMWADAASGVASGMQAGMSAASSALQMQGFELSSYWQATMSAIGSGTSSAITMISAAFSGSWATFVEGLTGGLGALVPIITALGGNAQKAAYIIGGIALAAAAVYGILGLWGQSAALAGLGAGLIATAAVGKRSPSKMAAAPSVTASAVAGSGQSSNGGTIILNQYYSGAPIVTGEQIAAFTAQGLRGMVGLGITAPREVIPA